MLERLSSLKYKALTARHSRTVRGPPHQSVVGRVGRVLLVEAAGQVARAAPDAGSGPAAREARRGAGRLGGRALGWAPHRLLERRRHLGLRRAELLAREARRLRGEDDGSGDVLGDGADACRMRHDALDLQGGIMCKGM
eukprot:scaffold65851_cov53-Phaeocystis_antarctica.AAC.2